MQAWKRANEPPECSGRYLCVVEYGRRGGKYKLAPVRYDADKKQWRVMYIADDVTHWMPSPEAPEGITLYEGEQDHD